MKIFCRPTKSNQYSLYMREWVLTFFYVPETHIMYFIRPCWFIKCSEEIHYVPIGDGWREVMVRNVIHSNAPRKDVAPLKTITYRAIKTTGTLIVNYSLFKRKIHKGLCSAQTRTRIWCLRKSPEAMLIPCRWLSHLYFARSAIVGLTSSQNLKG